MDDHPVFAFKKRRLETQEITEFTVWTVSYCNAYEHRFRRDSLLTAAGIVDGTVTWREWKGGGWYSEWRLRVAAVPIVAAG